MRTWRLIVVLLTVLLSRLAWADGLIVISNPPTPLPGHFSFAPLEVRYHKVDCTITDQVAVTAVDQEFYNPNNARLEGDYIFPLPEGSQINQFSMDINGEMVKAELLPADKARTLYEEIVRKAKDPALLEYAGRALYKVHIFPIEPHSTKRVQLKYTELLRSDSNLLDYHYTLNTEKYSSKPLQSVAIRVAVRSTTPLTTLYSPTHTVETRRDTPTSATISYEATNVRPDTDFHLYIGRKAAPLGLTLLSSKPDANADGYFVLLASPTLNTPEAPLKKDVVFVIDTSGSMQGDKIDQAHKALAFCINALQPEDRFEVVRFSSEAEPLFRGLQPANAENRKKATDFAARLQAMGGTAIGDALATALAARPEAAPDRPFLMVFLTDGQPTVGETNVDKLVTKFTSDGKSANVRIFSFGVGTDVNTALLDRLATDTRGYSQYVLPQENLEVTLSKFFSKIQDPVLANLSLDAGGAEISKLYPRDLPDLFKGDQLVAFGRYHKSGKATVTLRGTVAGKAQTVTQELDFADRADPEKEWIGKLWAVRRIAFLLDQIRLHGENRELKEEITQLARSFGIVTPYTAMLILEDDRRRGVPEAMRSLGDLERNRVAADAVKETYRSLQRQDDHGAQAVASSIASNAAQQAQSLDQAAAVTANTEVAKRFANGSAASGKMDNYVPYDVFMVPVRNVSSNEMGGGSTSSAAPVPATAPTATHGYRVVQNYAQQSRLVNRRVFFQNGSQWIDARVQDMAQAKRQQLKFNSDAYFALLRQHPEAAAWLALGNNVLLELGGEVYEITD